MDELSLALELDRRVTIRGGLEVTRIPEGVVIRHRELANVHSLNAVILDAPLPARIDASALTALTDHWLAGLDHRFVPWMTAKPASVWRRSWSAPAGNGSGRCS
jgi:hypothetical protein